MYFFSFYRNSSRVTSGVFEIDMKKWDHSLTMSFASINSTSDYRLFMTLASFLNREIYSLNGSSSPCRISFKPTFIFGLSLLVAKANLNFSLKSITSQWISATKIETNFNRVDFNNSGNAWHIIKAKASLYDNVDSNTNKWSYISDDMSYNQLLEVISTALGLGALPSILKMSCWKSSESTPSSIFVVILILFFWISMEFATLICLTYFCFIFPLPSNLLHLILLSSACFVHHPFLFVDSWSIFVVLQALLSIV